MQKGWTFCSTPLIVYAPLQPGNAEGRGVPPGLDALHEKAQQNTAVGMQGKIT